jgi:hypothetical protein
MHAYLQHQRSVSQLTTPAATAGRKNCRVHLNSAPEPRECPGIDYEVKKTLTVDAQLVDCLHKLLVHLHTPHHARLLAGIALLLTSLLMQHHSTA